MKKILSLIFLLILSCDNSNDTYIENFTYPLALGNSWTYLLNIEQTHTPTYTCTSSAIVTIIISDIVELNNGLQTYEMTYTVIENEETGENCINDYEIKYYINNTDEGLIYYAINHPYSNELDGLPKISDSTKSQISGQLINPISSFYFNFLNRDCIYYLEPPAIAIAYPVKLNNTWIGIDNNLTNIYEECANSSVPLEGVPLNSFVDQIIDTNADCFTVIESGNVLPALASDQYTENTKTYCLNIGLTNFIAITDFGDQTATDSSGNFLYTINNSRTIELALIEHTIY